MGIVLHGILHTHLIPGVTEACVDASVEHIIKRLHWIEE